MNALCTIRDKPEYRREAFVHGLKLAGYTLRAHGQPTGRSDLLVIWNRYGANGAMADSWERQGGTVVVAENGYIGRDPQGLPLYAMALHGHNGSGWFPVGDEDRFGRLRIALEPFRESGEYVLVCGQRGIGTKLMASPDGWHDRTAKGLAKEGRKVRIRPHPGRHEPTVPLETDLAGAEECVVWSSSAGVKALTLGIPVAFDAPHWIAQDGARRLVDGGPPKRDEVDRLRALHRVGWGQWTVAEIASGEPFNRFRNAIDCGVALS